MYICLFIVNGGWGNWVTWAECSVTCGPGELVKHRECDNPVPSHGGEDCEGDSMAVLTCNVKNCPGNIYIFYTLRLYLSLLAQPVNITFYCTSVYEHHYKIFYIKIAIFLLFRLFDY